MELLPIALISAAAVVACYIGKWVGKGNAFCVPESYKCDKVLFCKNY